MTLANTRHLPFYIHFIFFPAHNSIQHGFLGYSVLFLYFIIPVYGKQLQGVQKKCDLQILVLCNNLCSQYLMHIGNKYRSGSCSWYILFLFYTSSLISSCTTKNITPNHTGSHLLPIFKCCLRSLTR